MKRVLSSCEELKLTDSISGEEYKIVIASASPPSTSTNTIKDV
jgi:hypothetical protein